MKIIELENISFAYENDKNLFSNVSTYIEKWDFIWIFWENWKGKTTLVKIILWILKPKNGKIIWYDDNWNKTEKSNLNIEYISQKSNNLDSIIPISVKEIVKMWNKAKKSLISHFTNNCSYETIENSLKHVWMAEFINTTFNNLSGWQKQRVLIAKALISNPDIIIMDEATAWVDLVAQKHFYELISHLNKDHNITIILVSHDTKFIQEKIKRLWYIWNSDCLECNNDKKHLENIKSLFKDQNIEFFN